MMMKEEQCERSPWVILAYINLVTVSPLGSSSLIASNTPRHSGHCKVSVLLKSSQAVLVAVWEAPKATATKTEADSRRVNTC